MGEREAPAGARALLFECLEEGGDAGSCRVHGRERLRESVARELSRLLNTRCALRPEELAGRPRTVLEYGVADWSPAHVADPGARDALAAEMRRAVEAYEPRLRQVRVRVAPAPGRERALVAIVEGVLASEGGEEPVSFPVDVDGAGEGDE